MCAVAYIGIKQVGGWAVQKLSKLVINYKVAER